MPERRRRTRILSFLLFGFPCLITPPNDKHAPIDFFPSPFFGYLGEDELLGRRRKNETVGTCQTGGRVFF
jgi:hypothetical protein